MVPGWDIISRDQYLTVLREKTRLLPQDMKIKGGDMLALFVKQV